MEVDTCKLSLFIACLQSLVLRNGKIGDFLTINTQIPRLLLNPTRN